ncbi:MAG: hypothetical protein ABIK90_01730 [candidate division WOR-3 bacterium]
MKKRILFLIILIFFQFVFGYWVKQPIGYLGRVYGVIIIKGRNDDTNRVYVTAERELYELTYRNNSWNILEIGTSSGWGICAGDGRNDGRIRVYTTFTVVNPQYGGVYEYTWTGTNWEREIVATFPSSPHSSAGHAIVIGDVRNDGRNRIYSTDCNNNRLFESYWDGQRWVTNQILDISGVDMIVAKARRDGINRIYMVGQGTLIYEISWDGNRWIYQPIDTTERLYYAIACGYGRNDTVLRLYSGLGRYGAYSLYEFTWDGNEWEKIRVKGFPRIPRGIGLGDGRNEGVTRIYVGSTGGNLYAMEYSYIGNQWDSCWVDSSGISGTAYYGVCVGKARNDGINRVYFGCSDGYLYEFSYFPAGIKNEEIKLANIFKNKLNKFINPLGQVIHNQRLKKGVYFLYEKGNLKKIVKIK